MGKLRKRLIKTGRFFYAVAIVGIGFQHFFYGEFHPVILPTWPGIPGLIFWAYVTGLVLVAAGVAIFFEKTGRRVSLLLGGLFLLLICLGHVPYEIIIDPNSKHHLGLWANALKELALSGGAFVVAGSFPEENANIPKKSSLPELLAKIIPVGSIFFSLTMISFGIGHFMYSEFVSKLVPAWVPDHVFWTYFAGVALIGSGVAIILQIRLMTIGILLGSMIFFWFVFLHIPRAIANPFGDKGNEITSAFTALAFSGTAIVISANRRTPDLAL